MQKISGTYSSLALALLFSSSLALFGCSSSPDEAELKQLDDLKEETAALQKDVEGKEQEKGALDKEIADKNAKLSKCNGDQQLVKQRLGK